MSLTISREGADSFVHSSDALGDDSASCVHSWTVPGSGADSNVLLGMLEGKELMECVQLQLQPNGCTNIMLPLFLYRLWIINMIQLCQLSVQTPPPILLLPLHKQQN
jgi:hypothetical protein